MDDSNGTLQQLEERFLTVGAVAARLGVSPQTVRNWSAAGILRAIRHPINRYRLFCSNEVRALAERLSATRI